VAITEAVYHTSGPCDPACFKWMLRGERERTKNREKKERKEGAEKSRSGGDLWRHGKGHSCRTPPAAHVVTLKTRLTSCGLFLEKKKFVSFPARSSHVPVSHVSRLAARVATMMSRDIIDMTS